MSRKSLTFDFTPRGWTSFSGDHPSSGGCSTTWLLEKFRVSAKADYLALEVQLLKLTKAQLQAFLVQGGREHFCGLITKEELVSAAHRDQYYSWYPYVEEVDCGS